MFGVDQSLLSSTILSSEDFLFSFVYASFQGQTMNRYNPAFRAYNKLDYVNGRTIVTHETYFKQERIEFCDKYLYDYDEFDCTQCRRKSYL